MPIDTSRMSHEMKVFYREYRKMVAIQRLNKLIEDGNIVFPRDTGFDELKRPLSDSMIAFSMAMRVVK